MIDIVKRFFVKSTERDSVEKGGSLHDITVATCALLLEMSRIDGEFSDVEREVILSIIKSDYCLDDQCAAAIVEAADKDLDGSQDLWQFASLINRNYSNEEKIKIIEMVWHIAYRDGRLDQHEDFLVHKLANLLRLTHRQLIDAKVRVRAVMGIPNGYR